MKNILISIISLINWLILNLSLHGFYPNKSSFYFAKCRIKRNNTLRVSESKIKRTHISVKGEQNEILCNKSLISNSQIYITGSDNKVHLRPGVKLRGSKLHIRGSNCRIIIGENSSFGGVRMVNVGKNNDLIIGQDCLFADFIEIWASDTHSIFNDKGEMINHEKSIKIENNVWIGSHVIILKGVTIGKGSVVGMGSMVTRDVPAFSISAGRPNSVIKENISWKLDYL